MSGPVRAFFEDLVKVQDSISATIKHRGAIEFDDAFQDFLSLLREIRDSDAKLIIIGNGGSAAIASHSALDLWKNGGVRAMALNDSAQLTAMGNDYGYEEVFARPLRLFASPGDVLVAISSSGRSPNIIKCVETARDMACRIVTLSGFAEDNPLRTMGDLNIYVPSSRYGIVENIHLGIFHAAIESLRDDSATTEAGD